MTVTAIGSSAGKDENTDILVNTVLQVELHFRAMKKSSPLEGLERILQGTAFICWQRLQSAVSGFPAVVPLQEFELISG